MGFEGPTCNVEGVLHGRYRTQNVVKRSQRYPLVLSTIRAELSVSTYEEKVGEEIEEEIPKGVLIWRAIKLPIYSVALVPLTVSFSVSNYFLKCCASSTELLGK